MELVYYLKLLSNLEPTSITSQMIMLKFLILQGENEDLGRLKNLLIHPKRKGVIEQKILNLFLLEA